MARFIRIAILLCIVIVLLGVLSFKTIGARAASAQANASTCAWNVVPSPDGSNGGSGLSGVAAISASDVWAVGNSGSQASGQVTVIEHWNGTAWSLVANPNPGTIDNTLYAVSAVSSSNVRAVGYFTSNGNIQTLIENWNGTSWQVVTSPNPGLHPSLWAVTAISATSVWAVGSNGSSTVFDKTLTEHWNGKQWNVVKSPSPGTNSTQLVAVFAVSAHDVWAVGHADNNTLTENYHC